MSRLIFNNRLNAGLTGLFIVITTIIVYSIYHAWLSLKTQQNTACETPYVAMDEVLSLKVK